MILIMFLHLTMTLKEHVASFPDKSEKVYVTNVEPIGKKSPLLWDLITSGGIIESSVAVGSTHVTGVPVDVVGIVRTISLGQSIISGESVSWAV